MTEDDLFEKVVKWFRLRSGIARIAVANESGSQREGAYGVVNLVEGRKVHLFPSETEYINIPDATDEPVLEVPVLEWEWRFSLNVYAKGSTNYLRKVVSAGTTQAGMEPLLPFTVHRFSDVRRIPEQVDGKWEDRAQVDMFIRGLARDGVPVDLIETVAVKVTSQNGVTSSGEVTKP